ncbi:MAG: FAD:protein FMN transferase [Candidatus Eisenbacteria bacterium]
MTQPRNRARQTASATGARSSGLFPAWGSALFPALLPALVPALILALLVTPACSRDAGAPHLAKYVASRDVMSTIATITAIAPDPATASAAMDAAFAALDSVEAHMSAFREESDLGRVNRDAARGPVQVSPETFAVLSEALRFSRLTGGAFDVTVGPLLELWRTCAREDRWPTAEQLDAVRSRVGSERVILDADRRTVAFPVAGMRIDLGAIAKGYAVDRAVAALRAQKIAAGIVEVGGDLVCFGAIPGNLIGEEAEREIESMRTSRAVVAGDPEPWPLGIQSPFGEELLAKVRVREGGVATSGHYRRFTTIAGQRISHIVDPRTGWPVGNPASVTVIATDGLTSDALATGITVLGLEAGLALADSLPGVEAFIIAGQADAPVMKATAGFPEREPLAGRKAEGSAP